MKRIVIASCVVAIAASGSWAAERVWTGGGGNMQWSTLQNWLGGQPPLAGDVAVFNGVSGVTITVDTATAALAGVKVASSAFALVPSDSGIRLNGTAGCVFDIGEDSILTNGVYNLFPADSEVIKSGAGEMALNNIFYGPGGVTLDITEGSVRLLAGVGGDGLNVGTGSVVIRDGATLYETAANLISNRAVIDVREGGTFDGTGCGGDAIGAIIGDGFLTNVTAHLTLPDGKTYQFDGTIASASLTLGYSPAATYNTGLYRIADPTNHANATLSLNATNVLVFAAGIGEARVGRIRGANQAPFISQVLEDESGAPVQLTAGYAINYTDTFNVLLEGAGGWGMTNQTQTLTNALPYRGPTVVDTGARLFLGNGADEGGIPDSAYLLINTNAYFAPRPPSGWLLWDKPTFGSGSMELTRDGADFGVSNLFMTNGIIRIGEDNSTNNVTLSGGNAAANVFNINAFSEMEITGGQWEDNEFWRNATGSVFTVSGGAVAGGIYRTRDPNSPPLRLTGGSSTNVYLFLNDGGALEITGGSHFFRSALVQDSRNALYHQSGGVSGFVNCDAHNNTNDVFITMTGGTMFSLGNGNFRGLGAALSNDARFVHREATNVRIASDGVSHTVRLHDQSYMEMQTLQTMSSGGPKSCGRVILQDNATLALRGGIDNGGCNATSTAHLHFNGGTLRLLPPGGWTFTHNDYAWHWIEEGGLKLDIQGNNNLTINASLQDGTGTGNDGGIRKSGIGRIQFNADQSYTGPTLLKDGNAYLSRLVQTFYGGNEIRLQGSSLELSPPGSGTLEIAPLGSAGTIAYEYGFASLILNRGSYASLTFAFPSFTRAGNGTLLLYSYGNSMATVFGATDNFKLLAPPPQFNGILCPSVAAFQNNESPRVVDFLRFDPADGILRRANYGALTDGPSAIAQVSASDVINDTHVHALKLSAATLTLNSGQTLTLGDGANPAGLILNNTSAASAVITGGTLDFGNSEGIIWNSDRMNSGGRIASAITGTQGITVRGITINSSCEFTSANAYSGGTRIQSGTLSVNGGDRLGPDGVWVYGSRIESAGGSLRVSAATTIPNNLHLLGLGHNNSQGALRCEANVAVTGTVEVSDLARIGIGNGIFTVTLSGGVYGNGQLDVLAGPGRLRLTAPATHTGGTLITSGTLEIAEGGTLGGGSVSNNATLVFSNTSDILVTNDIWGTGAILLSGTGRVTFTGTTTCTILPGASSALGDGGHTFGNLGGTGTLHSAGALLTVGGTGADAYFAGTLTGGISVEKTGPGTLTLAGQNQNTGTLTITDGTVRLGGLPSLPTAGLVYQLDAQNDASVLRDTSGTVTGWLDATPNGFVFTEALSVNRPLYREAGINGLPSVYFGGWTNRLATLTATNVQHVFAVTRPESANMKNLGGLWGRSGGDTGLRVQSPGWQIGGAFNDNGQTFVNGVQQNAFTMNVPHLVSASASSAQNWATAIGDYWGNPDVNGSPRSYAGDLGELLVYNHAVNDATRVTLEMLLSAKWQLDLFPPPAATGILSPASALAIDPDGILDLNGSTERVARLDGTGIIINSAALVRGTMPQQATLIVRDGDFSGTIAPGVTLAIDDGGTLILRNDRTLDALDLHPGATLDLAGAALCVTRLSGTGRIINGTVTVTETIAPEGTLELPATATAAGCTLEIPIYASACGALQIAGDFDIATLHIEVTAAEPPREINYLLVSCAGQLTGAPFATATLPSAQTSLRYGQQTVELVYQYGTRIILR